jgi:hypothetical protein
VPVGEVRIRVQRQEGYLGWIYADWRDRLGNRLIEDTELGGGDGFRFCIEGVCAIALIARRYNRRLPFVVDAVLVLASIDHDISVTASDIHLSITNNALVLCPLRRRRLTSLLRLDLTILGDRGQTKVCWGAHSVLGVNRAGNGNGRL